MTQKFKKFIHVEVSNDLHEKIECAAKANGNSFDEWVRDACEAEANYDIYRHRKRAEQRKAVKP